MATQNLSITPYLSNMEEEEEEEHADRLPESMYAAIGANDVAALSCIVDEHRETILGMKWSRVDTARNRSARLDDFGRLNASAGRYYPSPLAAAIVRGSVPMALKLLPLVPPIHPTSDAVLDNALYYAFASEAALAVHLGLLFQPASDWRGVIAPRAQRLLVAEAILSEMTHANVTVAMAGRRSALRGQSLASFCAGQPNDHGSSDADGGEDDRLDGLQHLLRYGGDVAAAGSTLRHHVPFKASVWRILYAHGLSVTDNPPLSAVRVNVVSVNPAAPAGELSLPFAMGVEAVAVALANGLDADFRVAPEHSTIASSASSNTRTASSCEGPTLIISALMGGCFGTYHTSADGSWALDPMVGLLLREGADLNAQYAETSLPQAVAECISPPPRSFSSFLRSGNALHWLFAAYERHYGAASFRNPSYYRPSAATCGALLSTMRTLLRHGVHVNAANSSGATPLDYAQLCIPPSHEGLRSSVVTILTSLGGERGRGRPRSDCSIQ